MLRTCRQLLLSVAVIFTAAIPAAAQANQETPKERQTGKAAAYYHFALGHLYAELTGAYGNEGDLLDKAIDNYREALKADPEAALSRRGTLRFVRSGRPHLREAVSEAQAALEKNPNDANSRRLLGHIYMRLLGDPRQGSVNEEMVQRAIEQFKKLSDRRRRMLKPGSPLDGFISSLRTRMKRRPPIRRCSNSTPPTKKPLSAWQWCIRIWVTNPVLPRCYAVLWPESDRANPHSARPDLRAAERVCAGGGDFQAGAGDVSGQFQPQIFAG